MESEPLPVVLAIDGRHNASICALAVVVVVPKERSVVIGECTVNPAVPIRYTPDGDPNTRGNVQASAGDCLIIPLLLSELRGIDGLGDANVELCDGNFQTGSGQLLKLPFKVVETTSDQMRLCPDTVDGCSPAFDTPNKSDLQQKSAFERKCGRSGKSQLTVASILGPA
jgi:hypothetical protein